MPLVILPDFDAAQFTPGAPVNNRYYPLEPGTVSAFVGSEDGEEVESNDYYVTSLTQNVLGVTTLVIRDTAYEEGILIEDTIDFYAQDTRGNVWYFGEKVINYEYDDEDDFLETNTDGQWLAGDGENLPGWIMPENPKESFAYFNEFAPEDALDFALVVEIGVPVETEFGELATLQTFDSSALEPAMEHKFYAPNIGTVLEAEDLDDEGEPAFVNELKDVVMAGESEAPDGADPLIAEDFESDGETKWITVIDSDSEFENALGYYTFDLATGDIGEGFILFESTDEVEPGDAFEIDVSDGLGIGLFFVPNAGELGIDVSDFEDGGLFFENFLTGETASLSDGMAPIVTDEEGNPLPISVFHALGQDDQSNLLNPGLGLQAVEWEPDEPGEFGLDAILVGFEDMRQTQEDFDGDFDDLLIVFADDEIAVAAAAASIATTSAMIVM